MKYALELALDALEEIYDWTEYKETPWAKRARKAIVTAQLALKERPVAYLHEFKPHAAWVGSGLFWKDSSPHGDDVEITPLYKGRK